MVTGYFPLSPRDPDAEKLQEAVRLIEAVYTRCWRDCANDTYKPDEIESALEGGVALGKIELAGKLLQEVMR